jgi:hypothetical protein
MDKYVLTKEDAVNLSRQLWQELALTGKDKADSPILAKLSTVLGHKVLDNCPLCEYADRKENGCAKCPLVEAFGESNSYRLRCNSLGFDDWQEARLCGNRYSMIRYAGVFHDVLVAVAGLLGIEYKEVDLDKYLYVDKEDEWEDVTDDIEIVDGRDDDYFTDAAAYEIAGIPAQLVLTDPKTDQIVAAIEYRAVKTYCAYEYKIEVDTVTDEFTIYRRKKHDNKM